MNILSLMLKAISENSNKKIIVEEGPINRIVTGIENNVDSEGEINSITISLEGYYTKVTLYSYDVNQYYIIDNDFIISIV